MRQVGKDIREHLYDDVERIVWDTAMCFSCSSMDTALRRIWESMGEPMDARNIQMNRGDRMTCELPLSIWRRAL